MTPIELASAVLFGLDRLSLRFQARHAFYRGVAIHRRESADQDVVQLD